MKIISYILIILTIPLTLFHCDSKSDWREDIEKQNQANNQRLSESKAQITNNIKDSYLLKNSYKSKELAVSEFLNEVLRKETVVKVNSFVNWDENLSEIFPNTYGYGTALDNTTLTEYRKIIEIRNDFAFQK